MNETSTTTLARVEEKGIVVTRTDVEVFLRELLVGLPTDRKLRRNQRLRFLRGQIRHVQAVLAEGSEFEPACAVHVPFARCRHCLHVPL